jgi:hypothetical protein
MITLGNILITIIIAIITAILFGVGLGYIDDIFCEKKGKIENIIKVIIFVIVILGFVVAITNI